MGYYNCRYPTNNTVINLSEPKIQWLDSSSIEEFHKQEIVGLNYFNRSTYHVAYDGTTAG